MPTPTSCSGCSLQFSAPNYSVNEDAGFATITVTRSGDTGGTVSVDFATSDVGATQRFDYTLASGTVTLNPGEVSKNFTVLIVDDLYVESAEVFNLTLSNPTGGAVLGAPTVVPVTIVDNDVSPPTSNPIEVARFFVQLHYYDFLARFPSIREQGGSALGTIPFLGLR